MKFPILLIMTVILFGCLDKDPNRDTYSEQVLEENEITQDLKPSDYVRTDSVYVPIYSNIYSRSKEMSFLLTATLSIRNTSFSDTLYINSIDYYNTEGDLVNRYLEQPIFLKPMASIDYVVDEEDDSGGSGANFIVVWGSQSSTTQPIIQAVMISTNGQQGVAFTTEGKSLSD
ncbi:MAG: DUF3124 domain-containing protein [Cytophagales bacterium]|nr:DUF3124 domain-containing protein [Cytophagales bacterium]